MAVAFQMAVFLYYDCKDDNQIIGSMKKHLYPSGVTFNCVTVDIPGVSTKPTNLLVDLILKLGW